MIIKELFISEFSKLKNKKDHDLFLDLYLKQDNDKVMEALLNIIEILNKRLQDVEMNTKDGRT